MSCFLNDFILVFSFKIVNVLSSKHGSTNHAETLVPENNDNQADDSDVVELIDNILIDGDEDDEDEKVL